MSYINNDPTTRIPVAGRGRVAIGHNQPSQHRNRSSVPAPQAAQAAAPMSQVAEPTANGGWAVATLIFFWPLAFVAFSRSLSVPMLLAQGRGMEAEAASDSVARLGKIAIVCGVLAVVLLVVVEVVILREASSLASRPTY